LSHGILSSRFSYVGFYVGYVMPKKAKELSAVQVRRLVEKGFYSVGGVSGLHLQVKNSLARSWILRTMVGSARRDIGIGGYPDVGLSDARDKAREMKERILQGVDPVAERKQVRQALSREQKRNISFAEVAKQTHNVKIQEFKNKKHAAQWITTLETYAFPAIGQYVIDDITVTDILGVLEPIWAKKTETATRVRQRIATVFDHALATGLRSSPNPAAWKGCLQPLLPAPQKIKKRQGKANNHHPALSMQDMKEFMSDLKRRKGNGARALEFAILTSARTGEVRGALWSEIDFKTGVWELSAERMKADRPHRVPLPKQALRLLNIQKKNSKSHLIFTSDKNTELSDSTLNATIKRMHQAKLDRKEQGYIDMEMDKRTVTTHGFRSTFKDWSRRDGKYNDEWSELALAHVNSDQTRAAYARDELINERAVMMQAWADYCDGKPL
jgi:integrase